MNTTICSLLYLFRGEQVCLPFSLSGPTKGKRSGYGGKLEEDETIEQCAIRETEEESGGVKVLSLEKVGVMTFNWDRKIEIPGLSRPGCTAVEVHIYRSFEWEGNPTQTDKFGPPEYFNMNSIPYHQMMPCEEMWIPQMLNGEAFTGEMHYAKVGGVVRCRCGHLHKRLRSHLINKP